MSYNHENLIVGCGNILYGDDGFGPEVIKYMNEHDISLEGDTVLIDAATSAPHYLFTLPEDKWKNIIIVDIAKMNEEAGCIKVLKLSDVKEEGRYLDVHGISVSDPLRTLENTVNIKIVAIEAENFPDEMQLGLSKTLQDKIPDVVNTIKEVLNEMINE